MAEETAGGCLALLGHSGAMVSALTLTWICTGGGEHAESSEQLCGEKSLGQMLTQEALAVTVRGSKE